MTGEPYIRFYAGQPLHGPGGHKVGSLCIADRRPRTLRGDELEVLLRTATVLGSLLCDGLGDSVGAPFRQGLVHGYRSTGIGIT